MGKIQGIGKSLKKSQNTQYHTILKVKFLCKNSILTKPQHFHEFFTQNFLTIFLVKSKLSTAKKSKTTTFSRVFYPKNRQFSREIKVEFLDKNEDFEQCVNQFLLRKYLESCKIHFYTFEIFEKTKKMNLTRLRD